MVTVVCIINGNHPWLPSCFPNREGGSFSMREGGCGSWQSRNAREQRHLTTIARVGNNTVKDTVLGNNGMVLIYGVRSTVPSIHHFMGMSSITASFLLRAATSTRLSRPLTALFSLVQCRISALVAAITTQSTALGQFANGG